MKIFITGATGFVGHEIVYQLEKSVHQVRLLLHSQNKRGAFPQHETVIGDTTDPLSLEEKLAGCDAVINLVGIIREFPGRGVTFARLHTESTRNLLLAAKQQGVKRFLQMSANGAREDAVTDYHKTKWEAEQLVRQSELDWTIFRPSLIFGANDQFVNMLAGLIRKLPLVPVMGDGQYRLQPVSVKDVATGFIRALDTPASNGKTYHCGGPQAYTYDEILDLIGRALGKKSVCKVHQPLTIMKPLVKTLQSIPQFPMTSDQLQMLLEENVCDPSVWREELQLDLQDFSTGIAEYLKRT